MSWDDQRREILDALQGVIGEHEDGALVGGFFLVAEMHAPDGSYLIYRSGDINGEGLKSWTGLGYLHSAVQAVEQQTWGTSVEREDDDGD